MTTLIEGLRADVQNLFLEDNSAEFETEKQELLSKIDAALNADPLTIGASPEDLKAISRLKDLVENWNFLPPPEDGGEDVQFILSAFSSGGGMTMPDFAALFELLVDLEQEYRQFCQEQSLDMQQKQLTASTEQYEAACKAAASRFAAEQGSAIGQIVGGTLQGATGFAGAYLMKGSISNTYKAADLGKDALGHKITIDGKNQKISKLELDIQDLKIKMNSGDHSPEMKAQIETDIQQIRRQIQTKREKVSQHENNFLLPAQKMAETKSQQGEAKMRVTQSGTAVAQSVGQIGTSSSNFTAAVDNQEAALGDAEAAQDGANRDMYGSAYELTKSFADNAKGTMDTGISNMKDIAAAENQSQLNISRNFG